ncbi:MAG: hypothetical protein IJP59_10450 [Muribaculaceae bacterium]|nr:hypothetical protein [Muribaculaceae bacterium]
MMKLNTPAPKSDWYLDNNSFKHSSARSFWLKLRAIIASATTFKKGT